MGRSDCLCFGRGAVFVESSFRLVRHIGLEHGSTWISKVLNTTASFWDEGKSFWYFGGPGRTPETEGAGSKVGDPGVLHAPRDRADSPSGGL